MSYLPTLISLLRVPLAFFFLSTEVSWRISAILLAGFSDFLDGYIARRYKICSRIGTIIDPLTDKFFVVFVIGIFLSESLIGPFEAVSLLVRDAAMFIFGTYVSFLERWDDYDFKYVWWGKLVTAAQFLVLTLLTLGWHVPYGVYWVFYLLGAAVFIELFFSKKRVRERVKEQMRSQC